MLQTGIVTEIIATFCENSPILRKNWPYLTPCDLKFDLIKKLSKYFRRTCRGVLMERRLPLFTTFLSFRVLWGAVIRPPPPGRAKVAQNSGRARVTTPNSKGRQLIRFLRHRASLINYDNDDNGWWPLSWHWIQGLKKIPKCRKHLVKFEIS